MLLSLGLTVFSKSPEIKERNNEQEMRLRLITIAYNILCISFSSINVVIVDRCNTLSDLLWEWASAYRSLIEHSSITINIKTKAKMSIFIPGWELMFCFLGFPTSCHMTINKQDFFVLLFFFWSLFTCMSHRDPSQEVLQLINSQALMYFLTSALCFDHFLSVPEQN